MPTADEYVRQFLSGGGDSVTTNASTEPVTSTVLLPASRAAVEKVKSQPDPTAGSQDDLQKMLLRDASSQLKPFDNFFSSSGSTRNAPTAGVDISPNVDFTTRNQRVDLQGKPIPLDVNQGGALAEGGYAKIASQGSPEAQLAVLKDMYPDKPARILDSGEVAIQLTDPKTGDPRDVLINPRGMDAHDLIDLAVQTPELAAAAAIAIGTEGAGFVPTATQIIASSIAGAVVKQAREQIAHRGTSADTQEQSISDFKTNTEEGIANMFFGGAGTIAAKALRGLSPFANDIEPDSLAFNHNKAREVLKNEFGMDFTQTPATRTGSTALQSVESLERSQPGARTVLAKMQEANDAEVRKVQNIATRGRVSEEQLGDQAIQSVQRGIVEPIEGAFDAARKTAESKGQNETLKLLDNAAGIPSGPRVSESMAGQFTQEQFDQSLAKAKGNVKVAYDAVKALPGGSGDILPGDAAADAAATIRKELPAALKTVEKKTGLVDASGKPITRTVEERQQLESGIPSNLEKSLSDLESLRGAKVSLDTLTKMKNAAFDEIARTEAVPGVKDKWFKDIAKAYSDTVDSGIASVGDPQLKSALENAKNTYKHELLPFDRPGIREMARSEFDTGKLSPKAVASRLFSGDNATQNYQRLKEVLGANNPAFKMIKRAWIDAKLEAVTDVVSGTIDANKLSGIIKDFRIQSPELADEFFGSNYKALESQLKTTAGIQGIEKLDANDAKALLSLRNPSSADFSALLQMQKNRAKAYFNDALSKIKDGLPIGPGMKPMEFIKNLYNTDIPSKDVQLILDHLATNAPDVRKGIATGALYKLLDDASVVGPENAARAVNGSAVRVTSNGLADSIGKAGSARQIRYQQLFGDAVVPGTKSGKMTPKEFVQNLIDLIAPGDVKNTMSSVGSIGGSTQTAKSLSDPIGYASHYAQKLLLATAYLSNTGQAVIGNRLMTPARNAVIANAFIAAEPTARAIVEVVGPDKAKEAMASLKSSIDRYVKNITSGPQRAPQTSPAQKNADAIRSFLRGDTNALVKIQAR